MSSKFLMCIHRPVLPLLLLLLALLMPTQRAAAQGQYYNSGSAIPTYNPDWMRWVPDSKSLAALSLPGTHDTMANDTEWYVTETERSWVLTQSLELRPQLDAGIRVLDIRARHINDRFTMHHSNYYLRATFDEVLATAVQFLRERPSETILMRVKQEHTPEDCTRSFNETFEWYRDLPAYSSFIWRQSHIPALGEVRGKIVILDDFASGQYGIPWSSLNKQDEWNASNPDIKWGLVRNQLVASHGGSPQDMYVNFLSASNYPYNPSAFAHSVNAAALNYLAAGNVQRTGAMMMDFPGSGLIDTIVPRNSPYTPYTLPPHGGSGGSPASSECPYGAVAVGVYGRAGQYLHSLGLVCRYVNADGSFGSYHYAGAHGGAGGSSFVSTCSGDMAVVGFYGRSGGYVDGLGMYCARPATWRSGSGFDGSLWVAGGSGGAFFSDLCRNGPMVTKLRLRSGDLVDQMQAVCASHYVDLAWSSAGPVGGKSYCTQINEAADPHAWGDNFLCSSVNHGLVWSSAGPVAGMRCTLIDEPADPYTWSDNYLCVPPSSPLTLSWSYGGPIPGKDCIQLGEAADPHTWSDNYLCY
jgi:hypothetical protein